MVGFECPERVALFTFWLFANNTEFPTHLLDLGFNDERRMIGSFIDYKLKFCTGTSSMKLKRSLWQA